MYVNGKNTLVKDNASTKDIIKALCDIVPLAVEQCKEEIGSMIFKSGDPLEDAINCCRYIRRNVTYKADGFAEQNIQLPGRMFEETKQADCKSFSLAFVGMMKALGHKNVGFRFASYRPNKIPTHVYNYVVCNGKKFTFDACVENLKESPRHTFTQDMKVQYLTGTPEMEYIGKKRKDKPGAGKKILLAPVRGAFLSIVKLNGRGLAHKLSLALAKDPETTKAFWEKLGGKFETLKKDIDKGKNKRPLFGESKKTKGIKGRYFDNTEDSYIGAAGVDDAAIVAFIAAATPALIAVSNLFKKNNIPEDAGGADGDVVTSGEKDASEPLPKGFEAADPESGSGLNLGFKPSPLMIGGIVGGLALVYFLTKKKK